MSFLVVETIAKKYNKTQMATLKFLAVFGTTKVPYFNGLIYECIHKNQVN